MPPIILRNHEIHQKERRWAGKSDPQNGQLRYLSRLIARAAVARVAQVKPPSYPAGKSVCFTAKPFRLDWVHDRVGIKQAVQPPAGGGVAIAAGGRPGTELCRWPIDF